MIASSGGICWNFYQLIYKNNFAVFGELVPYFDLKRNFNLLFREIFLLYFPDIYFFFLGLIMAVLLLIVFIYLFLRDRRIFIRTNILILLFYFIFWLIVPAHQDNMARFISVVIPIFYLLILLFFQENRLISSSKYCHYILVSILVISISYQFIRICYNSYRWGGIKESKIIFLPHFLDQ
jgi:hypothetical protein